MLFCFLFIRTPAQLRIQSKMENVQESVVGGAHFYYFSIYFLQMFFWRLFKTFGPTDLFKT